MFNSVLLLDMASYVLDSLTLSFFTLLIVQTYT